MHLVYIANVRIPTPKAHGLQIVKMCEAFARRGVPVTLIVPRRGHLNSIRGRPEHKPKGGAEAEKDPFVFYGVERNFSIEYLGIPDFIRWGTVGFWINQILFSLKILMYRFGKRKDTIIFTRDELSGWLMRRRWYQVFYDMHGFPEFKRWLWKISMRGMNGIITTNNWKIERCVHDFGIPRERLLVAQNGYDPRYFNFSASKEELRQGLGLPSNRPLVLYTGHFYDWKGAQVLAAAAAHIPEALVVFVGGTDKDRATFIERFRNIQNILVLPYQPHPQIPRWLKAADALVLPNSPHSEQPRYAVYSRFDTSPIKMFEYMASGTPIVASDLPSIREILNEQNAVLVEPDNPERLATAIRTVLENSKESRERAERAAEEVQEYTIDKRAEKILGFIITSLPK